MLEKINTKMKTGLIKKKMEKLLQAVNICLIFFSMSFLLLLYDVMNLLFSYQDIVW